MTLSNIEYVARKKRMLHRLNRTDGLSETPADSEKAAQGGQNVDLAELLHRNDFGEYYALQDLEE